MTQKGLVSTSQRAGAGKEGLRCPCQHSKGRRLSPAPLKPCAKVLCCAPTFQQAGAGTHSPPPTMLAQPRRSASSRGAASYARYGKLYWPDSGGLPSCRQNGRTGAAGQGSRSTRAMLLGAGSGQPLREAEVIAPCCRTGGRAVPEGRLGLGLQPCDCATSAASTAQRRGETPSPPLPSHCSSGCIQAQAAVGTA